MLLLSDSVMFSPRVMRGLLQSSGTSMLTLGHRRLNTRRVGIVISGRRGMVRVDGIYSVPSTVNRSVNVRGVSTTCARTLFHRLRVVVLSRKLSGVFCRQTFRELVPRKCDFCMVSAARFFSTRLSAMRSFRRTRGLVPTDLCWCGV